MFNNMFGVKLFNLKQDPVTLTAITVAATVGSTYVSYEQGKSAQRHQAEAQRIQERAAEIQRTRARRQAIAQTQQQQAELIARQVASGAGSGSSGAAGEASSLGSQVAANIGFATSEGINSGAASAEIQQANQAQTKGATAQALGQLPGQLGIVPNWSFQNTPKGS